MNSQFSLEVEAASANSLAAPTSVAMRSAQASRRPSKRSDFEPIFLSQNSSCLDAKKVGVYAFIYRGLKLWEVH